MVRKIDLLAKFGKSYHFSDYGGKKPLYARNMSAPTTRKIKGITMWGYSESHTESSFSSYVFTHVLYSGILVFLKERPKGRESLDYPCHVAAV